MWGNGCQSCVPLFRIKVICRVTICFLVLVISKNFFLAVLFVMRCYFTSDILMLSMRRMMRCRNTSICLGGGEKDEVLASIFDASICPEFDEVSLEKLTSYVRVTVCITSYMS